jgi:phosphoribosyl-AMP cyclohydrolase
MAGSAWSINQMRGTMKKKVLWPNFGKRRGLITVVATHTDTGQILMVGSANSEAFCKTLVTGYAHFWSRTRKRLWMKGETSGYKLLVNQVLIDCDGDAVIYRALPFGPTCHTGERNCFYRDVMKDTGKASYPTSNEALRVVEVEVNL